MKTIGDIEKWSWGEMTSDPNGKSSVTSTTGFIIAMIGCLGFIVSCLFRFDITFVYASITVLTIGAGLIGYKKKLTKDMIISGNFDSNPDTEQTKEIEEIK